MSRLEGNLQGLRPSQLKSLERLGTRKFPAKELYTLDQARELALLSRSLERQIGLLLDRKGRVSLVLVGKSDSIYIPELARSRTSTTRLRGLRLLHTHLNREGLSEEDLMDMLFLRLDAVIALTVSPVGMPMQWQAAHLLPPDSPAPYRVEPMQPWDQPQSDLTATALALEEELARESSAADKDSGQANRCILVSVSQEPRVVQERNLDELAELARTADLTVCGRMVQRSTAVNPRSLLGRGKMAELEVLALTGRADILVFDGELSPSQLHNLADITERKVLDRTQLILDIFAQHAVTKAGKLQVELAQLKYMLPRLTGKNRAMDRLMGGIGGRGPGETKLEIDRRRSRERMGRLRRELDNLRRQRSYVRSNRARNGIPLAALVGYTNAGKSTLLNTLTRSHVLAQNKLFATLDTTTRRLRFPAEREIVLADTVGFIRNLPQELMEAFQATLEELDSADLLIHVADASHPDLFQQIASVDSILEELDLASVPRLLVLNKWDLVPVAAQAELGDALPDAFHVSAASGQGLKELMQALEMRILTLNKVLLPEASADNINA
ncbi:MAG TPA: GTPase HflX [Candidatus Desulfovibrio intestinipullorum]|uniref:GTPase HflX n=1 Tax=Candidatus Desulfovibrio intestinipullorum TaxID=2838536 RepID=A0A9D1TRH3_9BACT|nr:GTPase HflX [Candidatus Desulfovibrio intestinipullorum]